MGRGDAERGRGGMSGPGLLAHVTKYRGIEVTK